MTFRKSAALACSLGAILAVAGCGGGSEKATTEDARPEKCRTIAPAELTHTSYVCALGGEVQAVADIMATVNDETSARSAITPIRKSAARIKAIRGELKRLNSEENVGEKGALAVSQLPKISKASRAMIDETLRISRDHPELISVIGPALDEIEL